VEGAHPSSWHTSAGWLHPQQ